MDETCLVSEDGDCEPFVGHLFMGAVLDGFFNRFREHIAQRGVFFAYRHRHARAVNSWIALNVGDKFAAILTLACDEIIQRQLVGDDIIQTAIFEIEIGFFLCRIKLDV